MLTLVTRTKLVVFGVITAVALTVTALYYVRLPAQVGIGRYPLHVQLANAGGIYPQAMVTYRGVEVGKVTKVGLGLGGRVQVDLQIDDGTKIPADSTAEIRSASVIGEQYVNFLPAEHGAASAGYLASGAVVPVARTVIPTTTTALLTSVDGLLKSVPTGSLNTTLDELNTALAGAGPQLGHFLDASHQFQTAAQANLATTTKLIDDAQPVLKTQQDLEPAISKFASSSDSFTRELVRSDKQLRGVLSSGPGFFNQVTSFSGDLKSSVPQFLTDADAVGEVLRTYLPALEHLLIVAPATFATFDNAVPVDKRSDARTPSNLWFKLGVPELCTTGWADANNMRSPVDKSFAPEPTSSYCKVPQNDPRVARGARNDPCPNGRRGASAADCGYDFSTFSVVKAAGLPAGYTGPSPANDAASSSSTGTSNSTGAGSPLTVQGLLGAVSSLPSTLDGLLQSVAGL